MGGTNIHDALTTMRNMFKADYRFDGMPFNRFIAIIITDGEDQKPALVQSAANEAHAEGIVVISVGKRLQLIFAQYRYHSTVVPLTKYPCKPGVISARNEPWLFSYIQSGR